MSEEKTAKPEGLETEEFVEEARKEQIVPLLEQEIEGQKEKYMRLYAEFENFKRMAAREKEDIIKHANEGIIEALLPSLDNLETALRHTVEKSEALAQGVEMTLRELKRILEKFGLKTIEALWQPFNPEFHHAITQVETGDYPEMTVVEELRTGYMYNGKVLRATLVAVSRKPQKAE
ncbi:MAG: nucleotide exchange factor GrpE [Nitrospiraceae bacterium]|nr:nucleotide exchange factor GrpE [Nitrospiraceae bacterium]